MPTIYLILIMPGLRHALCSYMEGPLSHGSLLNRLNTLLINSGGPSNEFVVWGTCSKN
jgi:hypothetical protein